MADRVRVGLIGAGRIGRGHARALAGQVPDARLVVVADVVGAAAESVAAEVGAPRWSADPAMVTADPEIDAVVICASTNSHAGLIAAAAEAGKAVFCEKPIALDLESTDAAIAAVERAGVPFQIGFQRRFDPAYVKAKALIESGALGRVEHIRETMRDPAPPPRAYLEVCGGLYRDMVVLQTSNEPAVAVTHRIPRPRRGHWSRGVRILRDPGDVRMSVHDRRDDETCAET